MDIIFNDLSLHTSRNTPEAWDCFLQFKDLIDVLRANGCGKLLCRNDILNESVCGLKIYDYLHELGKPQKQCTIDNSKKTFVCSIYVNYLLRIPELDNAADYFSLNRDDNDKSTSVAYAINHEYPVASVPLDPVFKVNPLKGYKNNSQKVECINFYDKEQEDLLSFILVPANEQKKIDAKKHPIWNLEPTKRYLVNIQTPKSFKDVGERTAFIKEHCTRIAELNGWKFDKTITDKNRTDGRLRKIYRSTGFKHENCYLSIDFEHPDLRFELCDKNGKHLGEVEARTGQIGKPEKGHDISVH